MYFDFAAGAEGNPASPHEEGRQARKVLEDARVDIARLVEVQSDDVLFTSGATESNALAILGHTRAIRERAGGGVAERAPAHVLYLPTAHASTVENVKVLAEEGVITEPLVIAGTRVDTDALAQQVRDGTALVAMEAVCGETGVVWNTREVAEVLKCSRIGAEKKESAPAMLSPFLHVDASQAPWTEKITRAHFGADMLTFDGSKLGVRGIGALIAHRTIPLVPMYRGGGQERGLRSGTQDPKRAAEFAACLRQAAQGKEAFSVEAVRARAALVTALTTTIPNIAINEGRVQAPNILNFSLPGRDTDYLVALLDEAGFAVSTKSACETDSATGSRAVLALTGDPERACSTLRVSWGPSVTERDLERFAHALVHAVHFIDTNAVR